MYHEKAAPLQRRRPKPISGRTAALRHVTPPRRKDSGFFNIPESCSQQAHICENRGIFFYFFRFLYSNQIKDNKQIVAASKLPKRSVDATNHLVAVAKFFVIPF